MKNIIVLLGTLLWVNISFTQPHSTQKEIILTGTVNGLFLHDSQAQVEIPCYYYNPKSESYDDYKPQFATSDSFYFRFTLEQPKLIHVLYMPVYLVPGDSVHLEFKYTEDNEKKNSKSWFSKVYSELGYDGNIGYRSFINEQRYSFIFHFNPKDSSELALDSAYENLVLLTQQYLKTHKVSPDYKKIIENDLLLLKVSKEFDLAQADSMKIIQTLKGHRYLFTDNAYNSDAYFLAVGSLQEAFASLYPTNPGKVLEIMKQCLNGDTYIYASLIFSNVLRQKLPVEDNPYSAQIAIEALNGTKSRDLLFFSNFILSRLKSQRNSNEVFQNLKVVDYQGRVSTIGDILLQQKSKMKYIDLWASWCGPCIAEIPYSKKVSEKFKNVTIKTIFISIDENKEAWGKAYKQLKMRNEISYCIADKENLQLLDDALFINSIPRYLLIDAQNVLQALHAPGPRKLSADFLSYFLKDNSNLPSTVPPPPPPKIN